MSFIASVKGAAASVAAATKAAAQQASASIKAKHAELKAAPTTVLCSGCPLSVDVPPHVWEWVCPQQHRNVRDATACPICQAPRPEKLEDPKVTCSTCNAVTVVPSSNFTKGFKEAGKNAKTFAVATAATIKGSVDHMRAAPTTFHCAHCNSLLAVPTGPWACQTCTTDNEEADSKCKQCGQSKSDQKAICGVCKQSTVIPSTNFVDGIKHGFHEAKQSSKKAYYDVAGKSYVTCGRCNAHVHQPGATASPQAPGATNPDGSPLAAASETVEGSINAAGVLMCPNCKNEIEH